MSKRSDLVGLYYSKIVKSLKYLEYSYKRTMNMPLNPGKMTESELEAWDSFCARFARTSDIFLTKYVRAFILCDDPAYDGGFVDQLNRAEKLGLIEGVETWMEIRELRNVTVHEYSDQDLEKIFGKIRKYSILLLGLAVKLAHETKSKQLSAICQSFETVLLCPFKLYLFGSRVDEYKKGGDIDLLVVTSPVNKNETIDSKPRIKRQIFSLVPEEKIDITVCSEKEISVNPFYREISKNMILLCEKI